MAKRRREIKTYKYECTLTGEKYTLTQKAENADDLMSVAAYYEMHAEKDDRPLDIKKKLGLLDPQVKEEKTDSEAEAETES